VPIGRYKKPRFHDPSALINASRALKRRHVLPRPSRTPLSQDVPRPTSSNLDPPYDPGLGDLQLRQLYTPTASPGTIRNACPACIALNRRGVGSCSPTRRLRECESSTAASSSDWFGSAVHQLQSRIRGQGRRAVVFKCMILLALLLAAAPA